MKNKNNRFFCEIHFFRLRDCLLCTRIYFQHGPKKKCASKFFKKQNISLAKIITNRIFTAYYEFLSYLVKYDYFSKYL